jgi:hypothetical protein
MLWRKDKSLACLGTEPQLLICQTNSLLLFQLFY